MRSCTPDFQNICDRVRVLNAVLHEQSVAVISVDIDAAEVELEVALSTALIVCCNVDCVDIKISTDYIVVLTAPFPLSRLAGSVSLGWPMWSWYLKLTI
jgi:hypothetical protein